MLSLLSDPLAAAAPRARRMVADRLIVQDALEERSIPCGLGTAAADELVIQHWDNKCAFAREVTAIAT